MSIGGFLQGALGGALGGAAIGGPFGAVLGGIGGGLAGSYGSDPNAAANEERRRYLASIANRQAPNIGPAAQADYSGFRSNQANLIAQLEAQARGEGPSVSREMFNQATNRNIAAQNAMMAGGRGNTALNGMMAMNNTARLGADAAQGAALGRVQEQNNAINNLGMQIYSGRGADEEVNRFNAHQRNQMAQTQGGLQNQFYGIQDNANLQGMQMAPRGPSLADQIMAGGGGLYSFYAGQQGNKAPAGDPWNNWARR